MDYCFSCEEQLQYFPKSSSIITIIIVIITTTIIIVITIIIIIIVIIITIIITRPKPAYSWQGLAGSWGQDTNQARIFWGILNVLLRASLNHKRPTKTDLEQ